MRKLLVEMVMVSALGSVVACGNGDKSTAKTPAQTTSVPAGNVDGVDSVHKTADVALATSATVTNLEPAEKLPRFTLELSEGKSGFTFRSTLLTDEAKAKIDTLFNDDKVDLENAHFEIEGYADNLGTKDVNDQYGLARAKAVKQYIAEHYEIPADCIHVVSYGMDKPVADNATPEGRARNRRVVIKVVD